MKKIIAIFLVNALTLIRVIGVFCLFPIFLKHGGVAAAILSITCYLTDCLDGILARKLHVSTFFGSMFDGIADKLFSCANLIVLLNITKFAIIPILFEIAIVTIQAIKFQKNINVKSSMAGKVKTWIISLTVISLYLVIDIEKLTFLPNYFINTILNANQFSLYAIMFVPLYVFELITLVSYLKFLKNYDSNQKIEIPEINIKLKKAKSFKDAFDNFCLVWLNNEFYEKYKDSAGLKDIRQSLKESKRL